MNIHRLCNGIDVWQIQALAEDARAQTLLSREELERSARFHNPLHGLQWRYFHCAIRDILSGYTNTTPQELRFALVASDKPMLPEFPGVFFNLSHSGDRALLAVTTIVPVGVDIESHRELQDRQALVKRNFSNREQRALSQLPEEEQLAAFYRVWTRKEAVIKAHGLGLGILLETFDVPCGALPTWALTRIRDTTIDRPQFQVQELPTASGFSGAVALQISQPKAVSLNTLEYLGGMKCS